MNRKKSPAKAPVKTLGAVHQGDVFVTFLREATSLGNEVQARRDYMAERELAADFEAWCAARAKA